MIFFIEIDIHVNKTVLIFFVKFFIFLLVKTLQWEEVPDPESTPPPSVLPQIRHVYTTIDPTIFLGSCTGVVCGTDKKCVMRSNSPKCICAPDCKRRDGFWVKGPVCGTDGVSYKSHCRLKKRSCRTRDQSLEVNYHGLCQSECT